MYQVSSVLFLKYSDNNIQSDLSICKSFGLLFVVPLDVALESFSFLKQTLHLAVNIGCCFPLNHSFIDLNNEHVTNEFAKNLQTKFQ